MVDEAGSRELSSARKSVILITCCLSLLIVSMDSTIVNVALPSLRAGLSGSVTQLQWVIDIYTLVLAALLMLSGAAADRFGRRRVFQIGLVVFAVGSLLCSLAPSVELLIAARAVQAIGGSMLNPVAMSIITQVFTDPRERARAVGLWGAVVGISMAIGPVVGGLLIETVGWRGVFWVNLPLCAVALLLTALVVPESRSTVMRTLDPVGQLLAIVVLGGLVYGLIEGPGHGWTSPLTLGVFAVAALALVGFIRWERHHPDPFIDLRFFRSFPFSAAGVIAVLAFASYGAFLFSISLYLQEVRGLSPVHTGLMLMPLAVATLICSPLSGRAVGRFGVRPSLLVSATGLFVASLILLNAGVAPAIPLLLVSFGIFGIGFGSVNAPITTAAVSGMPRNRAGAASAVASTSRQVGVSIGVALAGTLTGSATSARLDPDFGHATGMLWLAVTAVSVVIGILGVVSATRWAQGTAKRVAATLITPEDAPR